MRQHKLLKVAELTIVLLFMLSAGVPQNQSRNERWLYPISIPDKGTGFIDQTGRVVIEPRFSGDPYGIRFSEGLAPVRVGDGWGYIDTKGKMVFTLPSAHWAKGFSDGLAGVAVTRKLGDSDEEKNIWGFIDKTGKWVIKPQFDEQYGFSEGLGRVVVNGLWGFIDRTGKFVVEPQFNPSYWFAEGFAHVAFTNDTGAFIDHSGQIASPPQYVYGSYFSEGLVPFYAEHKCGYMNPKWQVVIEPKFDDAWEFSDGVAAVKIGDHYGVIDKTGKFVLEPKYNQTLSFHEGLAPLQIEGKYGYIDKSGAMIIQPQFESAGDFQGGLAAVTKDPEVKTVQCCWHNWDYIDKSGKVVWRSPQQ
jgi:WG repeat protein